MGFLLMSEYAYQRCRGLAYNYGLGSTLRSSSSPTARCSTTTRCASAPTTTASAIASTSLPSGQLLLVLTTFAQAQAGNLATQRLNFLRIRAAWRCETDLDHRLLKILLVLLDHRLFRHRNRRVRRGLPPRVHLWVCMPSLCMLYGYN